MIIGFLISYFAFLSIIIYSLSSAKLAIDVPSLSNAHNHFMIYEIIIIISMQAHVRVLQHIIVAATLPSYGLKSVEQMIGVKFPTVRTRFRYMNSFKFYYSIVTL